VDRSAVDGETTPRSSDVIHFLTMYSDAGRTVVRLLGEIDAVPNVRVLLDGVVGRAAVDRGGTGPSSRGVLLSLPFGRSERPAPFGGLRAAPGGGSCLARPGLHRLAADALPRRERATLGRHHRLPDDVPGRTPAGSAAIRRVGGGRASIGTQSGASLRRGGRLARDLLPG
jgi:hypothetical protein